MKVLQVLLAIALMAPPLGAVVPGNTIVNCASRIGCKAAAPFCAEYGETTLEIGICAENPNGKRTAVLSLFQSARVGGIAHEYYSVYWKGACVPLSTPDSALVPNSADWASISAHMDANVRTPCPPVEVVSTDPCPEPWTTCPTLPCSGTGVGLTQPLPEPGRSCLSYAIFERGKDPADPRNNAIGFLGTGWDLSGERHLVVVAGSYNYQGIDSASWPDAIAVVTALESCVGARALHRSPTWTALPDLEGMFSPVVNCETGDADFVATLERITMVAQANGAVVVCADAELSALRRQHRSRSALR